MGIGLSASADNSAGENGDEADRLAALEAYGILETSEERAFDDIVALIARICDTPMALVALIDRDRQWFKARYGLEMRETPRPVSFCEQGLDEDGLFVVSDAAADPRFADNPLVVGPPHVRFYAGMPLVTDDGRRLGTLCALDTAARPQGLDSRQALAMEALAGQVMAQLELRKALRERSRTEERLRLALITSENVAAWDWDLVADRLVADARFAEFYGVDPAVAAAGAPLETYLHRIHPEDLDGLRAAVRAAVEGGGRFEHEYRLLGPAGEIRWVQARGACLSDGEGRPTRFPGAVVDITDRKLAEEERSQIARAQRLLSQELSHRIKNIFAVVSALVSLSARQFPESRPFAENLRTRLAALARAHEFVSPSPIGERSAGASLHAFLADLFSPYAGPDGRSRVLIEGDDATFDDQAATPVALLFHELATNAAKYGALSRDEGRVRLTAERRCDRYVLEWVETGGPPLNGDPMRQGFGSGLATLSVEGQLAGRLERVWAPEGLRCTIDLPARALSRRPDATFRAETSPESVR